MRICVYIAGNACARSSLCLVKASTKRTYNTLYNRQCVDVLRAVKKSYASKIAQFIYAVDGVAKARKAFECTQCATSLQHLLPKLLRFLPPLITKIRAFYERINGQQRLLHIVMSAPSKQPTRTARCLQRTLQRYKETCEHIERQLRLDQEMLHCLRRRVRDELPLRADIYDDNHLIHARSYDSLYCV